MLFHISSPGFHPKNIKNKKPLHPFPNTRTIARLQTLALTTEAPSSQPQLLPIAHGQHPPFNKIT
jgi:hypothetical protein